jgi:hypothetical protein
MKSSDGIGYGPMTGFCDDGDEHFNFAVIIWKNCSRLPPCLIPCCSPSVLTFLCPAIISSRRMARKMVCTLKLGWTKQRAAAVILAVRGPLIPIVLRYSRMLGVSLNGTGRLASKSPATHTLNYTSHPNMSVLTTYPNSCSCPWNTITDWQHVFSSKEKVTKFSSLHWTTTPHFT